RWPCVASIPAELSPAVLGVDLPNGEIDQQYARCRRRAQARDHCPRALLEPRVFQQADYRQHQPDDRHVATGDERLAECRHHFQRTEPAGYTCCQSGDGDNKEWIYPQDKSDDDYYYPD